MTAGPAAEESETWSIHISASMDEIWDAVVTPGVGADPAARGLQVYVPGTGPGVGAVWLAVAPFAKGRVLAIGLQVVVWERPHRVMLRGATVESLQLRVLYHLHPSGAGTQLKLQHALETMAGQEPTGLARRLWLTDQMPYLNRLKQHCEPPVDERPRPRFSFKARPGNGQATA